MFSTYSPAIVQGDWTQTFNFKVSDGNSFSSTASVFSLNIAPPQNAIHGTSGNDRLVGNNKANIILGQAGNDQIIGKNGNDRLYGQDGNDLLKGDNGRDLLSGGLGNDNINGGKGADTLVGGAGNDKLNGGAGKDVYLYLASLLGQNDLAAGSKDVVNTTAGDTIAFNATLWSQLLSNGKALDALDGLKLGKAISPTSNIAYANHHLMIDVNADGSYNPAQDMTINIVGQASKVTIDAHADALMVR